MGFEEELLIIAFVAFVAGFAYAIWRGIKAGRVRREEAARREEARQAALDSQLDYVRSIRKLAEIHQAGKAQAATKLAAAKPATPPRKTEQAKTSYTSDDALPFLPGVGSSPFFHSTPSAEPTPYQGLDGAFGGGGASGSWDSSSSSDSGSSSSDSSSSSGSSSD